ncbi:MAG: HAMP domain-containing histidine kinase [Deltaproteobacteria bacterium]|nr:HAMP domain-containing histidine kinase [Deltaproteobacteria bacterium]
MGFRRHHPYCQSEDEIARRAPIAAVQHYVRSRLHRRLFMWFGASIVMTGATVVIVLSLFFPAERDPREQYMRLQTFVGNRFAEVWDEPARRGALANAMAEELDVGIRLLDPNGIPMGDYGPLRCEGTPHFVAPVAIDGGPLRGEVGICARHEVKPWGLIALAFLVAGCTLWAAAGVIARRIAKPIGQVASVAREIGEGNLAARVELDPRHRVGEIRVLGNSINEMAGRIQQQLEDQRELLAAVSHELRTPLGHLRILLEMARDSGTDAKLVDELEKEILEVDDLVGELLASSRLSFDTLSMRTVEGLDLGARALERMGLSLELLASDEDSIAFSGDATLIGRALANLLENARRYGEGAVKLEVATRGGAGSQREIVFSVLDHGAGFDPNEIERVFDPFYRGEHRAGAAHQSLGLGLSLVSRIAQAHGGRAWAENVVEDGRVTGARVSFSVVSRPDDLPANRPATREAAE